MERLSPQRQPSADTLMSPPRMPPVTAELMPSEVSYLLQETPTMGYPDTHAGLDISWNVA